MAVQIRAWITNFINTYIIPNGNNLITGQQANDVLNAMTDSMIHRIDDKELLNLREYKSTRTYDLGECCVYLGSIYQSSTNGNLNNPPDITPAHWDKITDGYGYKYSFPPYDNAETYAVDDTCRYQDRLWRAIAITQGNAPAAPSSYWIEVSASRGTFGEFWQPNTFYQAGTVVRFNQWLYVMMQSSYFSTSFNNELTAGVWKSFPMVEQLSHAQLLSHITASRIVPGRIYFVNDKNVLLNGVTPKFVDPNGLLLVENPDNQKSGNYIGFGIYAGVWSSGMAINDQEIVLYNGKYYRNISGDAGSPPDVDMANWSTVQKGKWRLSLSVNEGDVVIWNGRHYRNLIGFNPGNPTDFPGVWQLVASGSPTYISEIDSCYFDVELGLVLQRIDKRGNIIGTPSLIEFNYANPIPMFDWGNDNCYNNECKSGLLIAYNNSGIVRNCSVKGRSLIDLDLNDGTIDNIHADNFTQVVASKDFGKFLKNCILASGESLTTYTNGINTKQVFDKDVSQDNIRITTTDSNFRKLNLSGINIHASTTVLDIGQYDSFCKYCGEVEITSNADVILDDIIGLSTVNINSEFVYRQIRINPVGINVTLKHGLIKCPSGADLVINNGGFVILKSSYIGNPSLQVEYYQNY
jgi:hypothetical protein